MTQNSITFQPRPSLPTLLKNTFTQYRLASSWPPQTHLSCLLRLCPKETRQQHAQAASQCHTHLGIKHTVVRGQVGSLVAELRREGRGLRRQKVLSDADGAHQALHLCHGGGWGHKGKRVS